ncbi:MAG: hypothetical protein M1816_005002 [Peltula sp. TS41687]|nr:MAG: hypothetical protein M1816_005002 [Peltula sp. TS41687]
MDGKRLTHHKNDVDYPLDVPIYRILRQDIVTMDMDRHASKETRTTANSVTAQITSLRNSTTRTGTKIAPGKARDFKEVFHNETDKDIRDKVGTKAITSGDTRPGNNQRWPNSQQNGNGGYQNQQGQNRPWLNRSHNGTTRPQNGGTTNIPVKAYHGDPAEGHENAYEGYANELTDDTTSYDKHQEYEAYEEDFYGSDA